MPREKTIASGVVAVLILAYSALVFPRIFFRHDDWWILGNVVQRLASDWNFLWRPTLYWNNHEVVWFFRPGFKLLVYGFYQIFHLHYALWMAILLSVFVSTLAVAYALISDATERPRNALWFIVAVCSAVPLHFGSLAWMGEGMMNVPQLLLLMLSTFAFVRAQKAAVWSVACAAFFALALVFKESTVFHWAFLSALWWTRRHSGPDAGMRWALGATGLLAGIYLLIRLGWMPVNPGYVPTFDWRKVSSSLALSLSALSIPGLLWVVYLRFFHKEPSVRYFQWLRQLLVFIPYLSISMAVHIGHDFFSPGWFLVPGVFCMLAIALIPLPAISTRSILHYGALMLVLTLAPVLLRLSAMGWSEWGKWQRSVFASVQSAGPSVTEVVVRRCYDQQYPGAHFERVIGNEEGIRQMAFLATGRALNARIARCGEDVPYSPSSLVLDWNFPKSLALRPDK